MNADERATLAAIEHYDARRAALCANAWTDLTEADAMRRAIRIIARARAAELRDPETGVYVLPVSARRQTDDEMQP
jgi:hypothetical protein